MAFWNRESFTKGFHLIYEDDVDPSAVICNFSYSYTLGSSAI